MANKDYIVEINGCEVLIEFNEKETRDKKYNERMSSYNQYINIISKHGPFRSDFEIAKAIEILELYAQSKSIVLIAKIALNTGASLEDILEIKKDDVVFYCEKTNTSYEIPPRHLYIKASNKEEIGDYYFSVSGEKPNHSTFSFYFNQVQKKSLTDVSFLRFSRTFYYKEFIKNKNVDFLPRFKGMSTLKKSEAIGIDTKTYELVSKGKAIDWENYDSESYVFIAGGTKMAEELSNLFYKSYLDKYDYVKRVVIIGDKITDSNELRMFFKRNRYMPFSYICDENKTEVIKRYVATSRSKILAIMCSYEDIELDLSAFEKICVVNVDRSGEIDYLRKIGDEYSNNSVFAPSSYKDTIMKPDNMSSLNPNVENVSDEAKKVFEEIKKIIEKLSGC